MNITVSTDHPVPVMPLSGPVTVQNTAGSSTLYYADNVQVSSTNNQGSLAAGASQTFTVPTYVKSAGTSYVTITYSAAALTTLPNGIVLTPEQYGAVGQCTITSGSGSGGSITGTDDTAAIRAMMNTANSLLATGTSVTCLFGPKIYFVNSAPAPVNTANAPLVANSIIPIPSLNYTPTTLAAIGNNIPFRIPTLTLQGVPGQTGLATARTDAYAGATGAPSILGTPTMEQMVTAGFDGHNSLPLRVITNGISFYAPDQPTISGVDKALLTSSHLEECGFYTTTTTGFEVGGNFPANRPPSTAFALRNPLGPGMESRNTIYRSIVNGWGVGMVVGNHVVAQDVVMNYVNSMVAFDEYAATHASGSNAPTILLYIWCTGAQYWISGYSGSGGIISLTAATNPRNVWGVMGNDPFATPWTLTATCLDANSMIAGEIATYGWANFISYGGNAPQVAGKSLLLNTKTLDKSAIAGTATLVGGTVTVTTGAAANATTTSRVTCGILTPAGTTGATFVSAQSAGSITLKSTSATDTSVVWYEITNPGP